MLVPDHRMIHGPLDVTRGIGFGTWTVNDPERAVQLAGWGVSSIITNRPGLIAQHLEETQ